MKIFYFVKCRFNNILRSRLNNGARADVGIFAKGVKICIFISKLSLDTKTPRNGGCGLSRNHFNNLLISKINLFLESDWQLN